MEIKATCKICGRQYIKRNGKSLFCSDECKRARVKERYEANKEHMLDYRRRYRREHPEARDRFKERHPNYDRDRSRRIRGSQEHVKKCIVCGKEFTTWLPHKKTCSKECSNENRRRRKKSRQTPEKAHAEYVRHKYGSEEAHQEHLENVKKQKEIEKQKRIEKRKAEQEAKKIHGICSVCGKPFETFNPHQKTCGGKCSRKRQYARKDKRIPKEQIVDRDITLEALYRRDSGFCYLCGKKCNWDDKTETNVGVSYPSIDHILPVSRGGLHSWDNVRLACFDCNVKKSDELISDIKKMVPSNAYEYAKKVRARKRKTAQVSKDGNVIEVYESTAEAERMTGVKAKGIQNCARGERKSYGGYVWKYVD